MHSIENIKKYESGKHMEEVLDSAKKSLTKSEQDSIREMIDELKDLSSSVSMEYGQAFIEREGNKNIERGHHGYEGLNNGGKLYSSTSASQTGTDNDADRKEELLQIKELLESMNTGLTTSISDESNNNTSHLSNDELDSIKDLLESETPEKRL